MSAVVDQDDLESKTEKEREREQLEQQSGVH